MKNPVIEFLDRIPTESDMAHLGDILIKNATGDKSWTAKDPKNEKAYSELVNILVTIGILAREHQHTPLQILDCLPKKVQKRFYKMAHIIFRDLGGSEIALRSRLRRGRRLRQSN